MGFSINFFRQNREEIENSITAGLGLLALYFLIMRIASGSWGGTIDQFQQLWFWMSLLVAGFSVQVGLYTRLYRVQRENANTTVTGTSAAASSTAMLACCAHHLVDVLPIVGLSAATSLLAEFQVQFLIFGVLINAVGTMYLFCQLSQIELCSFFKFNFLRKRL